MDELQTRTIRASDGTRLAVREIGPAHAPVTVVFSHGFCLTMDAWLPQSRHLAGELGDTARLVFYDQRGHGRSEIPADPTSYTLPQLGDDLNSVIQAAGGTGRVVLVGHSMGGMTILSYAARHPETLARVAGVGLISTAAAHLSSCGIGRALDTPVVPLLHFAARRAPALTGRAWSVVRQSIAPVLGIPVTALPVVQANQLCCRMIGSTPILTIAALLAAFRAHDQTDAVAKLAHLPALVACGEADLITPMRHSLDLASRLPHAELVRVPRAGHMLELESPRLVSNALVRLIARARTMRSIPNGAASASA
ncbi:MAG: alpha/beta hydrolase [Mycobacterium sp.]|nr:alpha/beta hydrolase [Mycobacterium sp.]